MTMQRTPLLMSRILGRGATLDPNVEVVTLMNDGTHRQTLDATAKRGAAIAHALASHGIKVGDRIASFMWSNYRHLELYQAVPSMGCVLHTLNIRLSPHDLEYIINHAEDRVIFADEDLLPLLEPILGKIPTVELLVIARHGEGGESSFATSAFTCSITEEGAFTSRLLVLLSAVMRTPSPPRRENCSPASWAISPASPRSM